jgi:hypothetical protein
MGKHTASPQIPYAFLKCEAALRSTADCGEYAKPAVSVAEDLRRQVAL